MFVNDDIWLQDEGGQDSDSDYSCASIDVSPFTDKANLERDLIRRKIVEDPDSWSRVRRHLRSQNIVTNVAAKEALNAFIIPQLKLQDNFQSSVLQDTVFSSYPLSTVADMNEIKNVNIKQNTANSESNFQRYVDEHFKIPSVSSQKMERRMRKEECKVSNEKTLLSDSGKKMLLQNKVSLIKSDISFVNNENTQNSPNHTNDTKTRNLHHISSRVFSNPSSFHHKAHLEEEAISEMVILLSYGKALNSNTCNYCNKSSVCYDEGWKNKSEDYDEDNLTFEKFYKQKGILDDESTDSTSRVNETGKSTFFSGMYDLKNRGKKMFEDVEKCLPQVRSKDKLDTILEDVKRKSWAPPSIGKLTQPPRRSWTGFISNKKCNDFGHSETDRSLNINEKFRLWHDDIDRKKENLGEQPRANKEYASTIDRTNKSVFMKKRKSWAGSGNENKFQSSQRALSRFGQSIIMNEQIQTNDLGLNVFKYGKRRFSLNNSVVEKQTSDERMDLKQYLTELEKYHQSISSVNPILYNREIKKSASL